MSTDGKDQQLVHTIQQIRPGVLDIGALPKDGMRARGAVDDTLTTPRYQVLTSDVLALRCDY
jgi:hypothetical protein